MRVLLIVHANSRCDKAMVAKNSIKELIASGDFDQIVEIASSDQDVARTAYLAHNGLLFRHSGLTPVPLLREVLFGTHPRFPDADEVTIVGGVLNTTGGGCLNCAFDHLARYCHRLNKRCVINLPFRATYQSGEFGGWTDRLQAESAAKDLVWKLVMAGIPFCVASDSSLIASPGQTDSLIVLSLDFAGVI